MWSDALAFRHTRSTCTETNLDTRVYQLVKIAFHVSCSVVHALHAFPVLCTLDRRRGHHGLRMRTNADDGKVADFSRYQTRGPSLVVCRQVQEPAREAQAGSKTRAALHFCVLVSPTYHLLCPLWVKFSSSSSWLVSSRR